MSLDKLIMYVRIYVFEIGFCSSELDRMKFGVLSL